MKPTSGSRQNRARTPLKKGAEYVGFSAARIGKILRGRARHAGLKHSLWPTRYFLGLFVIPLCIRAEMKSLTRRNQVAIAGLVLKDARAHAHSLRPIEDRVSASASIALNRLLGESA